MVLVACCCEVSPRPTAKAIKTYQATAQATLITSSPPILLVADYFFRRLRNHIETHQQGGHHNEHRDNARSKGEQRFGVFEITARCTADQQHTEIRSNRDGALQHGRSSNTQYIDPSHQRRSRIRLRQSLNPRHCRRRSSAPMRMSGNRYSIASATPPPRTDIHSHRQTVAPKYRQRTSDGRARAGYKYVRRRPWQPMPAHCRSGQRGHKAAHEGDQGAQGAHVGEPDASHQHPAPADHGAETQGDDFSHFSTLAKFAGSADASAMALPKSVVKRQILRREKQNLLRKFTAMKTALLC